MFKVKHRRSSANGKSRVFEAINEIKIKLQEFYLFMQRCIKSACQCAFFQGSNYWAATLITTFFTAPDSSVLMHGI